MSEALSYLAKKGFSYKLQGDEAIMNCPLCGDTEHKFSINITTGVWQCFHKNSCGLSGSFWDFKRRLGDAPIVYKSKSYPKPVAAAGDPGEQLFQWFASRGITSKTVKAFQIHQKDGAMVFPYYKEGKLVNQKYRDKNKKIWQEKAAEQVLFGRDLIPRTQKELVIAEGELDAMSLAQLGIFTAVSVPSGAVNLAWIENEWDWLDRFENIYLAFDMDKAGEEGARKTAQRLGRWRCQRVFLPYKDANEWLQKGATSEAVIEALVRAKDMAPAIVKPAEAFFSTMLEEEREGLRTGFPVFDHLLGGLRQGEITVWTGRNGDGKTTFLNQLVLNLLTRYDLHRACIASFEMRPKWLLRWMAYQAGVELNEEGLEQFSRITGGRLFLLDTQEEIGPDVLLEAFEYLARRYGVETFIIDSLLRINLGGGLDWLEKQKEFMNRLTQFALTFEAHLHLVAHPRKGSSDGAKIDKVDISGSGDISNIAFNVVSIRRLEREEDPGAVLEVMKNRELGRLGAVSLTFDEHRKLFAEKR